MQIKSVILENFRGYKSRQVIPFNNMTAFVGKNDVGKSTVLEALDIFFNEGKGPIKIESSDVNVEAIHAANGTSVDIVIGVEFIDVPDGVVLDENNTTSLAGEHLLTEQGTLIILKRYTNAGKEQVSIYANHPSNPECCDLLTKKQSDLRKMTKDIDCDHNKNAEMRTAVWNQYELTLQMQEIDASKEDAKNIWLKLKDYLPVYCLFQSDRSNGDKDKEVQDPLQAAVRIIFSKPEIQGKCQEIYDAVMHELTEVSTRTLAKINEMNQSLANTLHPVMPSSDSLKWNDMFKNVSITGDNDIPINKRGSGVKRMILLNFFRAEAERNQHNRRAPGIIYAIEEPETAQHVEHQALLIESLLQLSQAERTQVVITTHSSNILRHIAFADIRLILDGTSGKTVESVVPSLLPYPSINEIAFVNFGEISAEYHDELYGHIECEGWLNDYKQGKTLLQYNKQMRDGNTQTLNLTKTEIIRNQIHHPENHHNAHFTVEELKDSINEMRTYIENKNQNP